MYKRKRSIPEMILLIKQGRFWGQQVKQLCMIFSSINRPNTILSTIFAKSCRVLVCSHTNLPFICTSINPGQIIKLFQSICTSSLIWSSQWRGEDFGENKLGRVD